MAANVFSQQGLYLWSLFQTGYLGGADSLEQITFDFTGCGEVQHVLPSRPCKGQTGSLSGSPLQAALQGVPNEREKQREGLVTAVSVLSWSVV